ncbi:DUF4214 domain-containing protein [Sulfuricurvum sp.]|uniref:DUF4214 domain-containing protein n=1 Tax=Sulfuricurvum sp. TaxID=2025608 RepID=UPI0035678AF7
MAIDTVTAEKEIAKIYLATFNRVPDDVGLVYWTDVYANKGASLNAIAQGFAGSAEYAAKYPSSQTSSNYVDAIYNNVFGRGSDLGGKIYWTGRLDDAVTAVDHLSHAALINEMLNAAKANGSTDGLKVENQATYAVDAVLSNLDITSATEHLVNITSDTTTIATAIATTTQAITLTPPVTASTPPADIQFTNTTTHTITYSDASALGWMDPVSVSLISTTALNDTLTTSNFETINIGATNLNSTTLGANAIMQTLTLTAQPTLGYTVAINITTGNLTGFTLVDSHDLTISSVNANGVKGDGTGTVGTGFVWTTGTLSGTTTATITGSANGGDHIDAFAAYVPVSITETKGTNFLSGSAMHSNHITGGTGNDTIIGGSAADIIIGGGGADVIEAGRGADTITISGNTSVITQGVGDSGTNTVMTNQTSELTSTFDIINGLVAGDKIDVGNYFATSPIQITLAGTNLASGGDNKAVFTMGTYDSIGHTFTYNINGHDTALTYDSNGIVGTTTAETIILVGYQAGAQTAAVISGMSSVITLA